MLSMNYQLRSSFDSDRGEVNHLKVAVVKL